MNLENIQHILLLPIPDNIKKDYILEDIASDETAIEAVLTMLNIERHKKKKVITELNLLISQADTIFDDPKLNKDNFFGKKIKKFFEDYSGKLGIFHCFKS